jgi:nitrate/nitrite transporter NarK
VIDVVAKKEIWLCAVCILCGYQLVSASAAFSAYFQQNFGMTAVTVGFITVAQMWMRPIGAITAGIAGDLTQRESTLAGLFIASSLVLASIVLVSKSTGSGTLLAIVLAIAVVTSAVRGIYWGSLESCSVSPRVKGLAIGIISLVGYSPDVYLPLIYGRLIEHFPGTLGYEIYFCGIALMGLLGAASAWRLKVLCARRG